MKAIKNIKFWVLIGWNIPAVFVHEFMHFFAALVLGRGISSISIKVEKKNYILDGTCYFSASHNKYKDIIITMAPIITLPISIMMMIVNVEVFALVTVYFISTISFTFPSNEDMESAEKSYNNPYWRITK